MLSNGPIFCSSKNQHTISLSSAKVEYIGVVNAATQCVWLQGILGELGFTFDSPNFIWFENQSEIKISTNPLNRKMKNHIEIHMHCIRSLVHEQVIS